jgi:hypothetical protein
MWINASYRSLLKYKIMEPIYSSKQVYTRVNVYTRENENAIKAERFEAQILISSQKERMHIREYIPKEREL